MGTERGENLERDHIAVNLWRWLMIGHLSWAYRFSATVAAGVTKARVGVQAGNLPPFQSQVALSNTKLPPTVIAKTIIRNALNTLFHDDPIIIILLHLRNAETYSTSVSQADVQIRVMEPGTGTSIALNAHTCRASGTGLCEVEVSVAAFMNDLAYQTNLRVEAAIQPSDGGAMSWQPVGQLYAIKAPASLTTAVYNTVAAVAPSHPLYAGDEFVVEVRSRFQTYLKTAEIQLTVGAHLEIVYDSTFPRLARQKNGKPVFAESRVDGDANKVYCVLAGRKDGKSASTATSGPTDEVLFEAKVRVKPWTTTPPQGTSTIQITKLAGVTDPA